MLPLRNHNGQYILSLDSLDISLLSQYIQRPHDEKSLLWTRPYLDGEASYHQVEIVSEELQDEDLDLDDYEIYLCHICNVNVPQTYHKEHTKSKKHQTYKKLAAKFLENTAKQINTNFDNFKNNNHRDSFYCETCSKVVSLKHKKHHEKSDYHLKCIENDKLIDSVLKMYYGNKKVSEEYDPFSDTNGLSGSSTEYSVAKPLFQNKNIKNVSREITDRFIEYKPKKEEFISSIPFRNVLDTKEEIMALIKQIIEECNSKFVLPIMQSNCVTIVTPNGSKEQISISTYFGYKSNVVWGIVCQVCKDIVSPADVIQHIATELHLRNILRPVNNNFVREVIYPDDILIFKPPMVHCLLCNELVHNESAHATEKHPHLKQEIPLNINKNINTPLTKYCDVCDRNIGLSNFTDHIKSKTHSKNLKKSVTKTEPNPIQKKATNSRNAIMTFCDICSISIQTHNFLAHTKGSKHKDNIKKNTPSVSNNANTKNKSYAVPTPLSGLICEVCNVRVPSGGMEIHIKGKPHKTNLAK